MAFQLKLGPAGSGSGDVGSDRDERIHFIVDACDASQGGLRDFHGRQFAGAIGSVQLRDVEVFDAHGGGLRH